MSLCIIQLSDIHFRAASTVDSATREELKRRIRPVVRGKSLALIAVTGDIAYQGLGTEYGAATAFFTDLIEDVSDEGCTRVQPFFVPGNHDCDMIGVGSTRALVADSLVRSNGNATVDQDVINACTAVQSAFHAFAATMEATAYQVNDGLWKEISIEVEGKQVAVFGLNVAWLSKIKEKYGELMFPVSRYEQRLRDSKADLNIVLMHHPANWMVQGCYHALRALFRKDNTLVLSGHEHNGGGYQIKSIDGSEYLGVECLALVPEKVGDDRGFATIEIDLQDRSGSLAIHHLDDKDTELSTFTLRSSLVAKSNHQLTESFVDEMSDPGGNFTGISKTAITLADIFTYPDLKTVAEDDGTRLVANSGPIVENIEDKKKIIFFGHELAGKSTLLHWAFRHYHSAGLYPIYVKATAFNNAKIENIRRKIEEAAVSQYRDGIEVLKEKKDSLILLLDDLDELLRIPKLLQNVVRHADEFFGRLVATAEQGFNITELIDGGVRDALADGYTYEILPFGHKNRYELVKKWCRATGVPLNEDLQRKIHFVETTLNTVIGRNLAPAYPLYLLIILQGMEATAPSSLQNSSYAHYYQYLITKGLNEAGLKSDRHDEVMNYLANLAWFFRNDPSKEITEVKLQGFNQAFGAKFYNVVLSDRLRLLIKARILVCRKGHYDFAYPYIYYFFLGAYLSSRSSDSEVVRVIDEMCSTLRDRESAHTILFLTHHNKSLQIIQKVAAVMTNCYKEFEAFKFEKDAAELDKLISSTSQRCLENIDVEANRVEQRRQRDAVEIDEDKNENRIANDRTELGNRIRDLQLLFRTVEIVGQILKNYYGSLEREEKRKLLQGVFAAPMRLMTSLMTLIGHDPMVLAEAVASRIKEDHPSSSEDDRLNLSKRIAFDLLGMIAFGLITRPARDVSIEELDEDIANLVDCDQSTSLRLAQVASWLVRPANRHTDQIKALALELKDKGGFAYTLLQSLGVMHIRMFNMPEPERQRLCAALGISVTETRKKEIGAAGMKTLK